ncbi:MAG: roadblock/LC7 domain-containing protein [Planctomycetota bacterium]
MKEILTRLEGAPGIRAALAMTRDGVVIASLQDDSLAAKTAALISLVLVTTGKEAQSLGLTPSERLTLWADDGRLIVVPLGDFVLVVTADTETELGQLLMEVSTVPCSLARSSRIDVL